MHAARVESTANGVVGVVYSTRMGIHAIGKAYSNAVGILPKSGIGQLNRMLGNDGLNLDTLQKCHIGFVVGKRRELVLAMDWTEFDNDGQSCLAVYAVSDHGRATPLAWRTYYKSTMKGHQKQYEYDMVERLHEILDPEVRITLLADRGFGDQRLYELLLVLGWDFVIRFRGNIQVTSARGTTKTAKQWVASNGRAKMLDNARVTADQFSVPAVVVVRDKRMKEPWILATSLAGQKASRVVKYYGRRFTIEETFRDHKDLRYGMGLKATHIGEPARRDRLLTLGAVAHTLLTLLGAASERTGMDMQLKANTTKRRTHSLYRQGKDWYGAIRTMGVERRKRLLSTFDDVLGEHETVRGAFGPLCTTGMLMPDAA